MMQNDALLYLMVQQSFNPFKPEFTIVIFIHYNSRLVVDENDLKWVTNEKYTVIFKTVPWKLLF